VALETVTADGTRSYRGVMSAHGPAWAQRAPGGWRAPAFLLAVPIGFFQIVGTLFAAHDQHAARSLDVLAIVLLAAGPFALAARRRAPVAVLLVTFAVTLAYWLLGYPRGPIFLALIVAFVHAVAVGKRMAAVAVAVVGYGAFLWGRYLLGVDEGPSLGAAIALAAWLVVLVIVPEAIRARRERFMEMARTRAEESRRRASEERLRIARDLHDVLAHNISLINVQAGVALHLMDQRPEQARSALTAIRDASNDALRELRSVLDVLRQDGTDGAPRAPTPQAGDLDELLGQARAAGLDVTRRTQGATRALPAHVQTATYRIVQEALTNVRRHANAGSAEVTLTFGDRDLTVQIDDDGRGSRQASGSTGKGIAGMRERAAALGGALEAGPRQGGGFRVRATLPLDDVPRGGS
jgi:signal transduction histidine kinase